MQQQQVEKIKESQQKRAYHQEKIKVALEKNESEMTKKREVFLYFFNFSLFLLKNFKKITELRNQARNH